MMYITPRLETDRLILKRGNLDDYLRVYEYNFKKLNGINGAETREKNNPEIIKSFYAEADEQENMLDFIIYLKDNTPIGNVVLDRYDDSIKSLEVAINIHPDYWANGYAKEALVEIMYYVFNNLEVDNIVYTYANGNNKSRKVCEKVGFIPKEKYADYNGLEMVKCIMSKEDYKSLYKKKTK